MGRREERGRGHVRGRLNEVLQYMEVSNAPLIGAIDEIEEGYLWTVQHIGVAWSEEVGQI